MPPRDATPLIRCGRRGSPPVNPTRPASVCACFDGWEGDDCSTPRLDQAAVEVAAQSNLVPVKSSLDEMREAAHAAARRQQLGERRKKAEAVGVLQEGDISTDTSVEDLTAK